MLINLGNGTLLPSLENDFFFFLIETVVTLWLLLDVQARQNKELPGYDLLHMKNDNQGTS